MVHLKVHLLVQLRDATENSSAGTPKVVSSGLYKDAQKGAFGLKLRVHLR